MKQKIRFEEEDYKNLVQKSEKINIEQQWRKLQKEITMRIEKKLSIYHAKRKWLKNIFKEEINKKRPLRLKLDIKKKEGIQKRSLERKNYRKKK